MAFQRGKRPDLALGGVLPRRLSPAKRESSRKIACAKGTALMETFATHRSLWVANFELFSQLEHHPEIRRNIVNNLRLARTGLVALFLGEDESAISRRTAETIGTFHHVLLSGLIAQWLIDPGERPLGPSPHGRSTQHGSATGTAPEEPQSQQSTQAR
jgi:hypothetical protein